MSAAIATAIAGVPDQQLSPYCIAGHADGIRRALEIIETSCDDRVAWQLYGDFTADLILDIWRDVWGDRIRWRPPQLPFEL